MGRLSVDLPSRVRRTLSFIRTTDGASPFPSLIVLSGQRGLGHGAMTRAERGSRIGSTERSSRVCGKRWGLASDRPS